jgi:hypothetical protein
MKTAFATAAIAMIGASAFAANTSGSIAPTFSKDVASILYQRCVTCHRPGEAAPMALRTYAEVRPWAKAIKAAVLTRAMPPWFSDPKIGHFSNDRRLSEEEIATITKWSDAGAPEGNAADLPKLPEFVQGWVIGQPDKVISTGVSFKIPATGVVPYQYFKVDPGFTEDTWIQSAEVRPSQRSQVHHILVFVVEAGKRKMKGEGEQFQDMLIGYAPGVPTITWDPNTAFLVKAGSTLMFQVHYTTNGTAAVDDSVLGLKFRKDAPEFRALTGSAVQFRLNIPPGDASYETKGTYEFKQDMTMVDMTPHMHLRGKAFKYVLTYPDGHTQELLNVPHYDFNWQLSYVLAAPLKIPAGSKLECTAWYDNSPNNKYNPDPTQTVHWGDQTFEEMMIGFFNYTIPLGTPPPGPTAASGF